MFEGEEGKGQKIGEHFHLRNANKPQAFLSLRNLRCVPCLPKHCPNAQRGSREVLRATERSQAGRSLGLQFHCAAPFQPKPLHTPPCNSPSMPHTSKTPLLLCSRGYLGLECPSFSAFDWMSEHFDDLSPSCSLISPSLPSKSIHLPGLLLARGELK